MGDDSKIVKDQICKSCKSNAPLHMKKDTLHQYRDIPITLKIFRKTPPRS